MPILPFCLCTGCTLSALGLYSPKPCLFNWLSNSSASTGSKFQILSIRCVKKHSSQIPYKTPFHLQPCPRGFDIFIMENNSDQSTLTTSFMIFYACISPPLLISCAHTPAQPHPSDCVVTRLHIILCVVYLSLVNLQCTVLIFTFSALTYECKYGTCLHDHLDHLDHMLPLSGNN